MAELERPAKVELCVLCRRHAVEPAWRPFCSERCKLQDLARWADEAYRVPGEPITDPGDNAESDDDEDHG